jgi:glutamine synthetase
MFDLRAELDGPARGLHAAIRALEDALAAAPADALARVEHMRDAVVPAMAELRGHADRLERLVAADVWPLPTYAEMLFTR